MNAKILIAGAAIAALAAGGASAGTRHKSMHPHKLHKSVAASESKYAAPDQPIPYAQLDSYLDSHGMGGSDMGATKSSGHMKKMSKKSMKHHGKMHHKTTGSSSDAGMATPDNGATSAPDNGAMATPPATPPATPDTPSTPQ
ncbi:MAG: hypothetical protein M3T55_12435 [Pseudomonadota bacterium]|nr:hypothetical protein [Pseudomonadota bacterium]